MALLVRKVDKGKWFQNRITEGEEPSADAITLCMKTSKNTLSVWRIESDADLPEAALAQVAAGAHLETMDFAVIEETAFVDAGLQFQATPGTTRVEDLVECHRDVVQLTYGSLGQMARLIIDCFKAKKVERFKRQELRDLLVSAIAKDRLVREDLPETIRKKLLA